MKVFFREGKKIIDFEGQKITVVNDEKKQILGLQDIFNADEVHNGHFTFVDGPNRIEHLKKLDNGTS